MVSFAVLAVGLILVTAVLLGRKSGDNSSIEITIPAPSPSPVGISTGDQTRIASGPSEIPVKVYVSGAVRRPGVYELREGDRLDDALAAAGGVVEGADLESINLASRVRDEAYYHVATLGETPRPEVAAAVSDMDQPPSVENVPAIESPLVDLNTASADQLESLPGIGPARAQAILHFREQNGPFTSVDDILEVQGIAEGTFAQLRDLVMVDSPQ